MSPSTTCSSLSLYKAYAIAQNVSCLSDDFCRESDNTLLAICSAFSIKSLLFGNARVINESVSAAKWMNAAKFSVVPYRVFTENLFTFMQADHHSGNQPIVNLDYSDMCKVINSISDSSHYFA